ncbi:MAG: YlxM family DNA-binding protein [Clostridiales bacterium]|nr:YlxM family DNA-binding protein [Clostridiales bacterium]
MSTTLGHLAEITRLFDFYALLLTDKQRDLFTLYYEEDLSLAEIASAMDTSRQAVHSTLRRVESLLTDYENRLALAKKDEQYQAYYTQLEGAIKDLAGGDAKAFQVAMDVLSILKGGQNDGF